MRGSPKNPILVVLVALAALTAAAWAIVSCGGGEEGTANRTDLTLASTTSTQDSGLFDVLIPAFEAAYPYTVKVVAVGSGEAIEMGRTGDADVLLVHSPAAETTFMNEGYGVERKAVMYNDFIIVGPADDPAGIMGLTDAAAAFTKIAETEATFFARGDDSGTHKKEQSIWEKTEVTPEGDWYVTTGQGMGDTLTVADEQGGYTLCDRATYLTKKGAASLALEVLVEGDTLLFNQYHVITVKDAVNPQGAADFMNWIISDSVQQDLIASFGVDKYGLSLFFPNAGLVE